MDSTYAGSELTVFRDAVRWKAYVASLVRPFLGTRVLEVGAGMGGTTRFLCGAEQEEWVCAEPDAAQAAVIAEAIAAGDLPPVCRVVPGGVTSVPPAPRFTSILYFDVLEHIDDDRGELEAAVARLGPGGHLVILAPAHAWLSSPFDRAIGHRRRYDRRSLGAVMPPGLRQVRSFYLDAAGVTASLANRLLLRSGTPSRGQVLVWDRWLVPLSRLVDPLLLYSFGKSLLDIRRKS